MRAELDVLIKTHRHDLEPFRQVQRGLAKFSKLSGQVWVLVPARDLPCFRNVVASTSHLIADEYVLGLAGYHGEWNDDWGSQQLIKLLGFLLPGADAYLVLDSNTLLLGTLAPEQFKSGNRWVYEYGHCTSEDLDWERQTREFLGLPQGPLLGFRAVNQIFHKRVLSSLCDHLTSMTQDNWVAALQAKRRSHSNQLGWTEFNLYGLYAKFLDDSKSHDFRSGVDPIYYRPNTDRFWRVAANMLRNPPRMMKVYKRRPGRTLSVWNYRLLIAALRLVARAASRKSHHRRASREGWCAHE